ncbi:hypothetical protein [Ruminococcus albus]|uniref:WYL domain-containing protein n=1 Tax=Ruminococcus albus TaxID=1264 RepID=A0A1H7LIF2_RUMAL|nr:hypothetical protein [Ruminococcus albus]SEK98137.1 hypothetical protein SAMN05216469_10922 [Ruminococcus albus]
MSKYKYEIYKPYNNLVFSELIELYNRCRNGMDKKSFDADFMKICLGDGLLKDEVYKKALKSYLFSEQEGKIFSAEDKPIPYLLSDCEMYYMQYIFGNKLFRDMLGNELAEKLSQRTASANADKIRAVIHTKFSFRKKYDDCHAEILNVIVQAITENKMLEYEYTDSNGNCRNGREIPVKIQLNKRTGVIQIIAKPEYEDRFIKQSLHKFVLVKIADEGEETDFDSFIMSKRRTAVITVNREKGQHNVETNVLKRCINVFGDVNSKVIRKEHDIEHLLDNYYIQGSDKKKVELKTGGLEEELKEKVRTLFNTEGFMDNHYIMLVDYFEFQDDKEEFIKDIFSFGQHITLHYPDGIRNELIKRFKELYSRLDKH